MLEILRESPVFLSESDSLVNASLSAYLDFASQRRSAMLVQE